MSEEYFGGLKILAEVENNEHLVNVAAKTLVLYGAISSEEKLPDFSSLSTFDNLLEDASPPKKSRRV